LTAIRHRWILNGFPQSLPIVILSSRVLKVKYSLMKARLGAFGGKNPHK